MANSPLITSQHQEFIAHLQSGVGAKKAAELSGFDGRNSWRLMQASWVNQKLAGISREVLRKKIDLEGAPLAYAIIIGLLLAEKTSDALKADLSKFMINHSVPAPKAPEEGGKALKEPSQMTNEELLALIDKTDGVLQDRGLFINATPAQVFDDLI